MRTKKDALEIKALEISAARISDILDEVISGLEPGLTERQVARRIEAWPMKQGLKGLPSPQSWHPGPTAHCPMPCPQIES